MRWTLFDARSHSVSRRSRPISNSVGRWFRRSRWASVRAN